MTIADKLTRLSAAHDDIISAINAKGGSATGDGFEDFAADIAAIPGGGGGSNWTLLATQDFTVNTTATSASQAGSMTLPASAYTSSKILYVRIRDKSGARNGYFVGSDNFFFNPYPANGATTELSSAAKAIIRKASDGAYAVYTAGTSTGYGVYAGSINSAGTLNINKRYNSTYSLTVNSTYEVKVYALDYCPDQGNPFDYTYD